MKILFVTNEIPYPPDNGVRIVSHNAMQLMKDAGHELGLAVLTEEADDLFERFEVIKKVCNTDCSLMMQLKPQSKWLVQFKALLNNMIFPVERYKSELFRSRLRKLIEVFKPDVIHFDIITMLQYHDVVNSRTGSVASINDSYALTLENSLSTGKYSWFQYIYRKLQYYQTRKYESSICEKFDRVHLMTEVDAMYLKKLNSNIITSAIPNGVNNNLFNISNITKEMTDIIFVAKLAGENIHSLKEFIEFSWPVVQSRCPDAQLNVVGEITKEAEGFVSSLRDVHGINFWGYVEHLETAYQKCGIGIVPINKNCGLINKAIEAMASGLAVVGFKNTFSGLPGTVNNTHYISVNDYNEIGLAIIKLLNNKELCDEIKSSAHSYAIDNFLWSSRISKYESMYENAIAHANVN